VIDAPGVSRSKGDAFPALAPGCALGVQWPVRHSMMVWPWPLPKPRRHCRAWSWRRMTDRAGSGDRGLKAQVPAGQQRIEWAFEPVVTRAVRVRVASGGAKTPVADIEVLRFMPPSKDVWPDRLVQKEGLKQELLAVKQEPSFEALALNAHNMQSARAFVGLKDHPSETGVGWEGTLVGRETIQFHFGAEEYALGEYPDTVARALIDGWRPGVLVEGRMHNLQVRENGVCGAAGSPVAASGLRALFGA